MSLFSWNFKQSSGSLIRSSLFNESTFYKTFVDDLGQSQEEVIIESPYITASRMELLYPVFGELLKRGVKIHIITRDPIDHEDEYMRHQATNEILKCMEKGIQITLLQGFHHRKLAIIDKNILWEGSLNILSQTKSREIMRRIKGRELATQMLKYLEIDKV